MKDGYLTVSDAYMAVFLGAVCGILLGILLFQWALRHDDLCVVLQNGMWRCVDFRDLNGHP